MHIQFVVFYLLALLCLKQENEFVLLIYAKKRTTNGDDNDSN